MKRVLLASFFVLGCTLVMAQKYTVTGQVVDTLSRPLPSATVMLLNPKDSSLVNFHISDANGVFEMKNVAKGTYQLKVTFVGLTPLTKTITTPAEPGTIDAGRLKMEPLNSQLEEVVIIGEKSPVTVKRDTIEFNAGSFKTKANANVEDLLKKLPGVTVDTDGTVTAQGEQVQKVLVDGREFFGRDPKLATRNLPADAVQKVQVFDKKSDQSAFTGIEDGQREKTINLELKEEKRKGMFGKMSAGAGKDDSSNGLDDDRFKFNVSLNKFGKGKQLSFLGMGNNVNEQGFDISDFMNFNGGGGGGGGGGIVINGGGGNNSGVPLNSGRQSGIVTNYAGGVNFNRDLSPKTTLTSNYFYNHIGQDITRNTHRVNYLPNDSSYYYDESSRQISTNDNHRVNLIVDQKIDSANSIKSTNNFSYTQSDLTSLTNGKTTLTDGTPQNTSDRKNTNAQTSYSLTSTLLYRHKFAKKGRTFSTTLSLGLSQTNSNGSQNSVNNYYNPGAILPYQEIVQMNTQLTNNQSYGAVLSYIEPLGGRKYLEFNYNIRTNLNQVNRVVNDVKNDQEINNVLLSNKYNSEYVYSRPALNLRVNRQKYNFSVGLGYQNTHLMGTLKTPPDVDRTFESILPVAHFNYDFSQFKHFRLDYETNMNEPSIQQLQQVVDNSDPLNITSGNPYLVPSYQHRLATNITSFNPTKFMNFFGFITATYTKNPVISSQTVSPSLVRITKPVNVADNVNLTANLSFGIPVRKLKSRFNIGPTGVYSRGINVLNDQSSYIWQQTLGGTARYNLTIGDIFSLDLSANLSHQETTYEFNTANNQVYFNKTYSAETYITFLKRFQFNTNYDYYIYNSQTTSYNQTIPLWNMSISRFIMKNNVGEVKFGVNNLLDQSVSVSQSATSNYLQQQVTNNLGRYLMVSFIYSLNKQLNPNAGMRNGGGRGMQIIRQ